MAKQLEQIFWKGKSKTFVDSKGSPVNATSLREPALIIDLSEKRDIKKEELKGINIAGLARGANAYSKEIGEFHSYHIAIKYYNITKLEKK